jgi:hypothetical protein
MAIDHLDRAIVTRARAASAAQGPIRSVGRRVGAVGHRASALVRSVVALALAIVGSVKRTGIVVLRVVDRTVRQAVSRVVEVARFVVARVATGIRRAPSLPLVRPPTARSETPAPDDQPAEPGLGSDELSLDPA